MIDPTVLNLLIYSSQMLVIVAAAAMTLRLCAVSSARIRLGFWRGAVVACLILPFLPVRGAHVATGTARDAQAATSIGAAISAARAPAPALSAILAALPWILLAGAGARAAWLGLGATRLRRLRLDSSPEDIVIDDDLDVLRRAIAPRAQMRWHDAVAQPLTFGTRRPIVLLPRRIADLPLDARRAVVCHELLHVARHDWAWMIAEEIVRTVFWFHPAVWWVLGQVQLSREQTVDEIVVALTASRVPYMNALMLFADVRPRVASALPFVRRRHLASRLRQLSEEHTMSSLRFGVTSVALAGVLIGSSLAVASEMPLRARSTVLQTAAKRIPTVVREVKPEYPATMKDYGISADVTVKVDVSAEGAVTGAEAVGWMMKSTKKDSANRSQVVKAALELFCDAAKAAARQWTFQRGDSNTTAEIEFTFTTRPDAGVKGGVKGGVRGGGVGGVSGGVGGAVSGGVGGVTGSPRSGDKARLSRS